MKRVIIIATGFMMIALFSSFFSSLFENSMSEKRKLAINISSKLAKQFKLKYNLNYMGIEEEAEDGKYKVVGLQFNYKQKLSKNEGRKLLLQCEQEALEAFNSYPQFRQHMINYPFTGNNIHIAIFIEPTNNIKVFYPDICIFSFYNNALHYKTNSPENKFVFFTDESESIEEAVKIVESQQ